MRVELVVMFEPPESGPAKAISWPRPQPADVQFADARYAICGAPQYTALAFENAGNGDRAQKSFQNPAHQPESKCHLLGQLLKISAACCHKCIHSLAFGKGKAGTATPRNEQSFPTLTATDVQQQEIV